MQLSLEDTPYSWTLRVEEAGDQSVRLHALTSFEDASDRLYRHLQGRGSAGYRQDISPMFGVIWGSCRAVVDRLVEVGDELEGQRILELGCGLALPSLVAARYGAEVMATDMHHHAEALLAKNMVENDVSGVVYSNLDWREPAPIQVPLGGFDRVLACDVLFAYELPELVIAQFARFLAPGGVGWLTDPGRAWLDEVVAAGERHHLILNIDVVEVIRPGKQEDIYFIEIRRPKG